MWGQQSSFEFGPLIEIVLNPEEELGNVRMNLKIWVVSIVKRRTSSYIITSKQKSNCNCLGVSVGRIEESFDQARRAKPRNQFLPMLSTMRRRT